jgi:hypothetical protein
MKTKAIIWISVILAAIAAMIYYVIPKSQATNNNSSGSGSGNDTGSGSGSGSGATNIPALTEFDKLEIQSYPIKPGIPYGSYSRQVGYIQLYLNNFYGKSLSIDGKYGPLTKAAAESIFGLSEFTKELYDSIIKPKEAQLRDYLQRR